MVLPRPTAPSCMLAFELHAENKLDDPSLARRTQHPRFLKVTSHFDGPAHTVAEDGPLHPKIFLT